MLYNAIVGKRKKKIFSLEKEVRRLAREVVGQPPKERVIVDKRFKKPKHRKLELDD